MLKKLVKKCFVCAHSFYKRSNDFVLLSKKVLTAWYLMDIFKGAAFV